MKVLNSKLILIAFQILVLNFNSSNLMSAKNRDKVQAKIIRSVYLADKDSSIQLGLLIQLPKDWHIYWKNPGDTGIPTTIEWKVPKDFKLLNKHWSIPKAFEFDGLVSYGYEDQVLFFAELQIPNNTSESEINLSVKIESLICKAVCIPFDTLINYQLDLRKSIMPDEYIADLFTKTTNELPVPVESNFITASNNSDRVYLRIDDSSNITFDKSNIFYLPYENGLFANTIKQLVEKGESFSELVIEADQFRTTEPEELYGLLIFSSDQSGNNKSKAYEIKIAITK